MESIEELISYIFLWVLGLTVGGFLLFICLDLTDDVNSLIRKMDQRRKGIGKK